jgi:hypothetical protein
MISNSVLGAFVAALVPPTGLEFFSRRRARRAEGFECLPEPVFLIDGRGRLCEANRAGRELLGSLLPEGSAEGLGRKELAELFVRAAGCSLSPAPVSVETREGLRHYEIRFSFLGKRGMKTAILKDITVWKRILAEKNALLTNMRMEAERPLVVCARCGAVKGADGGWGAAGALSRLGLAPERLSHGLCPACLARELARDGLAVANNGLGISPSP